MTASEKLWRYITEHFAKTLMRGIDSTSYIDMGVKIEMTDSGKLLIYNTMIGEDFRLVSSEELSVFLNNGWEPGCNLVLANNYYRRYRDLKQKLLWAENIGGDTESFNRRIDKTLKLADEYFIKYQELCV